MQNMQKTQNKLFFAFVIVAFLAGVTQGKDRLEANFANPPNSARAHTWWHWMNGNVTAEGITKDLEAMKASGLGGFQAFHVTDGIPTGPVDYDSDQWHKIMAHTIREANRLGLEMGFHNCAGWSSSGGPWITPEHSMKEVVWSEKLVKGPAKLDTKLKQPTTRHGFYRDIAVLAFPSPVGKGAFRIRDWKPKAGAKGARRYRFAFDARKVDADDVIAFDSIVNLTARVDKTGRLEWDVPAGKWSIIRFGYTTTGVMNRPAPPEGRGLECDKLSKKASDLHWSNIVERVIADAGPLTGKTFRNVLIDSYEVGHQNWTHGFAEQFRHRRDYDIIPWLPCLTGRVVGGLEQSERFLWDMRRTIADLMDENYFGRFATLCHDNGLLLSIEPYGNGNFDGFQVAMTADIPMGEFWVNRPGAWHEWSAKLASSAAHIDGKRYVGAESFTAGGRNAAWISHPYSIKKEGDFYYTKGINRYIFHTFVHQPWPDNVLPGMTMGPHGMQMNRNNTWFGHSRPWFDRLARCQYLLQEGRFFADLLYIYGEDAPNTIENRGNMDPLPPNGYDYDGSGFETLMKLSVQDGRLLLPSGMRYNVLVLTHAQRMRPEFIKKVAELVEDGAVVVGAQPVASPSLDNYPKCDKQIKKIADELWGQGKMHPPQMLPQVLAGLDLVPDFETPIHENVAYIHRRVNDADVYFVSNQSSAARKVTGLFRVPDRIPELWHPKSGRIEQAPVWRPAGKDRTEVTLDMEPAGSVFVVFRKPATDIDPVAEVEFHPGVDTVESGASGFTILSAWYGDPNDPERRVDVTDTVAERAQNGNLNVRASNDPFGDPAQGTVKELSVEYVLDGKKHRETVKENQTLEINHALSRPVRMQVKNGEEHALLCERGRLTVRRASGKSEDIVVSSVPKPLAVEGPWNIEFGPMGPDETVTFEKLISWPEHENELVKYYSGTATYRTSFDLATSDTRNVRRYLDLRDVQVMARVNLNGKDLGLLWKPPYRVDATEAINDGRNVLEVEVVNLWPNRLIGDELYPAQGNHGGRGQPKRIPSWLKEGKPRPKTQRKAFSIWRHYGKGSRLLPSGLLGPVYIESCRDVAVASNTGNNND